MSQRSIDPLTSLRRNFSFDPKWGLRFIIINSWHSRTSEYLFYAKTHSQSNSYLFFPRMGDRPMMTEARADLTCWLASTTWKRIRNEGSSPFGKNYLMISSWKSFYLVPESSSTSLHTAYISRGVWVRSLKFFSSILSPQHLILCVCD